MKRIYIILFIAVAGLAACKKTDKTKPTFTVSSPADSLVFETGQNIPFNATFFDNENLSQYKVDIHDNFDGHDHDKYLATIWNHIIIENITGVEQTISSNILIPDSSASGWYHFLVTCVDASGNQSEIAFRNIFIRNMADTTAPAVNNLTPTEGSSITLGNSITVNADITDNERVYVVSTRVRRPNSSSNLFLDADTFGTNSINYNKIIPTSGSAWTAGQYEILFTAYDSYYNKYVKLINVSIN